MQLASPFSDLSPRDLEPILAVARKLATPFDLETMLGQVVTAARQVLRAERASVWLYEAATDELVMRSSGELGAVRVPASAGLVGTCARTRQLINVPDCYTDPRFDPTLDHQTGYHTRCILTLPLVGHQDALVGVMQVLNKSSGTFLEEDEALATVLAAQCAVALERVRLTEALVEGERMRKELEMARVVQRATLPARMPSVPGYDVHGAFDPAALTGGDTFDLALLDQGLMVVLADATGHGMGPALSVSQMQAMLRMAFRLGGGLEASFTEVNNLLAEALPGDHFITAFVGVLDPRRTGPPASPWEPCRSLPWRLHPPSRSSRATFWSCSPTVTWSTGTPTGKSTVRSGSPRCYGSITERPWPSSPACCWSRCAPSPAARPRRTT
jgi:phosphoserine phosphatase